MKRLILIILVSVITMAGYAQTNWTNAVGAWQTKDSVGKKFGFRANTGIRYDLDDRYVSDLSFNGSRPITGSASTGLNPGTNNLIDWINAVFYPSQPPTAALSGGTQQELRTAGSGSVTLNWSAGRQAATATLASVVVNGVSQTFTQPAAPGTVSGTQSVTITYNTNQTFTNTVTTTDGKIASATTSFTFSPQSYRGFISDTTNINNSSSDAAIRGLAYGYTSNRNLSYTTPSVSNQFFIYAYPSSFGALTSLSINGFPALASMSVVTRDFTNTSGYTQSYRIYYTKNAQTTSGYPVIAN